LGSLIGWQVQEKRVMESENIVLVQPFESLIPKVFSKLLEAIYAEKTEQPLV